MGPVMYALPYLSMQFRKNVMTSPEVVIAVNSEIPSQHRNNRSILGDTVNPKHVHYYNVPGWMKTDNMFTSCDYPCTLTTGYDIAHLGSDTAIVFHAPDIMTIPAKKATGQIWVIHSMESPRNHHQVWGSWNDLVNWTLGYRRDADIFSPYAIFTQKIKSGSSKDLDEAGKNGLKQFISRKAWKAKVLKGVWFVSKCREPSLRDDYAIRLQRFMDVHIFGECGQLFCWRRLKSLCRNYMKKWYKFYLSFENSLCRDYITEKSFNLYTHNLDLVPVIRNGANASLYLPPGSYVTTNDFRSIKSLGTYLNSMSKDYKKFNRLFQWKNHYTSSDMIDSNVAFCELCRRLHETDKNTKYHRLYHSIQAWLTGNDILPVCTNVVRDVFNITDNK
ncbi:alpha-(1,3)-fucosyltransferase C-like isoform X2 [Argopecten irradians]